MGCISPNFLNLIVLSIPLFLMEEGHLSMVNDRDS